MASNQKPGRTTSPRMASLCVSTNQRRTALLTTALSGADDGPPSGSPAGGAAFAPATGCPVCARCRGDTFFVAASVVPLPAGTDRRLYCGLKCLVDIVACPLTRLPAALLYYRLPGVVVLSALPLQRLPFRCLRGATVCQPHARSLRSSSTLLLFFVLLQHASSKQSPLHGRVR